MNRGTERLNGNITGFALHMRGKPYEFFQPIQLEQSGAFELLNIMLESIGIPLNKKGFSHNEEQFFRHRGPFDVLVVPDDKMYPAMMLTSTDHLEKQLPVLSMRMGEAGIRLQRFCYVSLGHGLMPSQCAEAIQNRMSGAAAYYLNHICHQDVTWVI